MSRDKTSRHSIAEATRSRAEFSGHGAAKGAAGYVSHTDDDAHSFLASTGQTTIFNSQEGGFQDITVGGAWHLLEVKEKQGFLDKLMKAAKTSEAGVDLDIGCLYELQNGKRGALQAFGKMYGSHDQEPFMSLSGDDRTGADDDDDIHGQDEVITINGQKWPEIKRLLIYFYIYGGAQHWAQIAPQVQIRVPGEKPVIVTLHTHRSELCVCAVAGMENVRNGIRVTNYTEYYPGHAEMDRAYGFGLEWDDGQKV